MLAFFYISGGEYILPDGFKLLEARDLIEIPSALVSFGYS